MNKFKNTLCLCMVVVMTLLFSVMAYGDNYEFTIDGPDSCGVGDTIEVTVTLSADEELEDSDAFFVYDTEYFDYIDSECDEYDTYSGKVRLRGDFSADSYSNSWTIELQAKEEGTANFEISDKWVKSADGNVVTTTSDTFSVNIGEAGSAPASGNDIDDSDIDTDTDFASAVFVESSYSFHFTEPEKVPACFDEATAYISGVSCKVWKFNSEMSQDIDYGADISEFYAVYGYMEDEDNEAWYVYDTETETFSRLVMLKDVEVEVTDDNSESIATVGGSESPAIINDVLQLIVIAFVVLVILLIVVNVIFNRIEKNARKRRIEERQRLSHEELRQKRAIENKIREKKAQEEAEAQSQNLKKPE